MVGVSPTPVLQVADLVVRYGGLTALRGVSVVVGRGECVALLGANGAGKSTFINTVAGLNWPASGRIVVAGRDLTSASPESVVRAGVSVAPEGRRLFPGLTVQENIELGGWRLRRSRTRLKNGLDTVYTLFPELLARRYHKAGDLSGGQQQMVAVCRALMADPVVLLLDEPSLGLAPRLSMRIMDALIDILSTGLSIVLVEQNAALAAQVAVRGYVLERGAVVREAPLQSLIDDPRVHEAYIG